MPTFEYRSDMPVPAAELFAWHARPGTLERLLPPWQRVRVVSQHGGIEDGAEVVLEFGRPPLALRWLARHRDYREGEQFCDEQIRGPFARWVHTHSCMPAGPNESTLLDTIDYELPFGRSGSRLGDHLTRSMLARTFRFRHERTRNDLTRHRLLAIPKRIAITGASGLVGSQLSTFLRSGGHEVHRLVRAAASRGSDQIYWNPDRGEIDAAALEGLDAVVHLAGENLFGWRWTAAKKRAIRESRERGTALLARTLAQLRQPPAVLISASAIGYYGDASQPVDETSAGGTGFLADVCRSWEAATAPAEAAGIRVVHLRIGVVLSAGGGALATMLLPFQLGLGGILGSGGQYFSWIGLDDLIGAVHFLIGRDSLGGAVNAVAPEPVTNRDFTKTLGRVLRRPTLLPVPAMAIRAAFGEMGEEMLLKGARVRSEKLTQNGFRYLTPDLESALRSELGKYRSLSGHNEQSDR